MQMKFAIMPNNVVASISPTTYSFSPYEQITASLSIIVPAALTGSSGNVNIQEVSVMAQAVPSGQLIGGATEVIFINN
jgi:hypothetical protein